MVRNTNITVYNKYSDPTTRSAKYSRSVVKDVHWMGTVASSASKSGRLASNVAKIMIPVAAGANYVAPKAWAALVSKAGKFTLKDGDVIVKGVVDDVVSDSFTLAELVAKYDDVVTITSVDFYNTGSINMHHWEVGAK